MTHHYENHSPRTLHTTRYFSCRIHTLFRALRKTALNCFEEAGLGKGDHILDYGCGAMPYKTLLINRGCEVTGADFPGNPYATTFIGPNGELDPQLTAQFDAVLSTQVLEHVRTPSFYLKEAHRVLKPAGVLLLSTHGQYPYHADPNDYWRWTHEGLKLQLERAGFMINRMVGVFSLQQALLQMFQDSTRAKIPRVIRGLYVAFYQLVISALGLLQKERTLHDALLYFVIASKQNSPSQNEPILTADTLTTQAEHIDTPPKSEEMSTIKAYYDAFGTTFIRDVINGNPRIKSMHRFLRQTIPVRAKSILLVGCGSGQTAWELVKRVSPQAKVLAIDLSDNNIRIARVLFSHPNVIYLQADILEDDIEGSWQYIVLPDIYEHIPKEYRKDLYLILRRLLTEDGRIILTCPTPWHQQMLRERKKGLQIVDEDVSLEDIQAFSEEIGGFISLYRVVSIWRANDYFHAIIERKCGLYPKDNANFVPIKGNPRPNLALRLWSIFYHYSRLQKLVRFIRRKRIMKKLLNRNVNLSDSFEGD